MLVREIVDRFKEKRPVCLMARISLARMLSADAIDEVFHQHADTQYERTILFSALMEMMASVTLGLSPSVNAACKKHQEKLRAARSSVYTKLEHVEPKVVQALVRYSYRETRAICNHLRVWESSEVTGYRTKILDGNHLAGTEHRLKELRAERAAALPGKSLVVLDPRCRAIQDMFPIEDGHAQERTALDEVIQTIEKGDLWLADRNFCTLKFLYAIDQRPAAFVIRHHENMVGHVGSKRLYLGKTATGKVYERSMTLTPYDGKTLKLRRIEVELEEPTRDGETMVVLLSNLPADKADALQIAAIYLGRWKIETAFQTLTTTLRCEVNTLGYPRAALFAFGTALVAYNAIIVVESFIRAEHGKEQAEQLSKYYLALEITSAYDGMMTLLDDSDFDAFREMPVEKFCAAMRKIAKHVDPANYRKSKRGPKKPVKKKPANRRKTHISTAKVLAARD